jgi:NAD(P)-dependent dehydrogenase (short-subunit alcohol dehydrogenase family)
MLLKDKVALITGGAGLNGLGYATARMMAAQGARVVILDLARRARWRRRPAGQWHLGVVADVTDKASCEAAAAQVLKALGRIDILVNNAGITQPRKTLDITPADYDAVLDVSLRGTLQMSQAVLPAMRAQKSAPSSASRRSARSAAAASWAARTTRRPRPACWAWPRDGARVRQRQHPHQLRDAGLDRHRHQQGPDPR